jgi:hypothetical protein
MLGAPRIVVRDSISTPTQEPASSTESQPNRLWLGQLKDENENTSLPQKRTARDGNGSGCGAGPGTGTGRGAAGTEDGNGWEREWLRGGTAVERKEQKAGNGNAVGNLRCAQRTRHIVCHTMSQRRCV